MMIQEERTNDMLNRYGEVCTRAKAAHILGRSYQTIVNMLDDGRLQWACAGTMVDVRSIARYINQPRQVESERRARRIREKYNSEYSV